LREDHHRLLNSAGTDVSRYGLVNQETDRMVNTLNTLAEQVGQWLKLRRSIASTHEDASQQLVIG
jgi:hypothetical protein